MPNVTHLLLFCLLITCTKSVSAEPEPAPSAPPTSILLAIENSWPPYADESGEGLSRQLVTAAFKAVGIEAQFTVLPYARVLFAINSGIVDGGLNVTRQDSTEADFIFGQEPLLIARASFYFRAGEELHYHAITDLPDNFRLGAIIGYEYGDLYETQRQRLQETRVSTQRLLLRMLVSGRIDGALMFDQVAAYTLDQNPEFKTTIRQGMPNHASAIYVAFSRQKPHAALLAEQLDKGLRMIQHNGTYQQIMAAFE